jgi:CMP-N-acetylneuraminic acid synthetase
LKKKIDYVVLLLGNSIIRDYKNIDKAITIIKNKKDIDSVITLSKFNMFNPFRAYTISDNRLHNFMNMYKNIEMKNTNDKNAFGDFYYLNGEFQVLKREAILSNGEPPFRWMGKNMYPMVLENNMEVDAQWQLEILRRKYD